MTAPVSPDAFGPVWCTDRVLLGDRVRWSEVDVVRSADESAVVVAVRREGRETLFGRGDEDGAVRLVVDLRDRRRAAGRPLRVGWMSLPRGAVVDPGLLDDLGLVSYSSWDWMSTSTPPPEAADEGAVVVLDPVADADAIRACLAEANPGTTADPTAPSEAAWFGVRDDDGTLLGVFGASSRGGPADGAFSWHLHGLGVRPDARGRGLGAALTAAITRAGLAAGAAWVSLGLYADNDRARAIYRALGFVTSAELDSYSPPGVRRPPT